ncbi:hypothetical protein BurJ1DRAFT_3432 [Burkholderiales bacterium JOSHI_001]|nr:hypothetical protein BurJ1DRAFT_3432 [Burkholderiales bacterium JOSHI_001]
MPLPRRFDGNLMSPPAPDAPGDALLLQRLRAWCEAGAFPRFSLPLAAASIPAQAGLDAAACELDGSAKLAQLAAWQGLAWRLRILLREQLAGPRARPEDPWDCGWWREGPLDAATAFRPRRPTLLLVREPGEAVAQALLAALQAHSNDFAVPLRVLVVCAQPVPGWPRL